MSERSIPPSCRIVAQTKSPCTAHHPSDAHCTASGGCLSAPHASVQASQHGHHYGGVVTVFTDVPCLEISRLKRDLKFDFSNRTRATASATLVNNMALHPNPRSVSFQQGYTVWQSTFLSLNSTLYRTASCNDDRG